jgi:hypothetical protein
MSTPQASGPTDGGPAGAYGLSLRNVDGARRLLVRADPGWTTIEIVRRAGAGTKSPTRLGPGRAELRLVEGASAVLERAEGRVTFFSPRQLADEALVHPYLAPVASVFAHWAARESLHAGAVIVAGSAWLLLGEKGSGKSSLLATLAGEGVPILADDLIVTAESHAYAGPRVLDLRAPAARALGVGTAIGKVGARERWRLELDGIAPTAPLGGLVFLAWGDEERADPLRPSDALLRLTRHRAVRVPPARPEALVELAALPAFTLSRPRRWESLGDTARRLLDLAAG